MKLTPIEEKKLRKCLRSGSYSTKQIAEMFGVTSNEMYEYCASLFKREGLGVASETLLESARIGGLRGGRRHKK